jgi:hypothetical protein
MMSGPIRLRRHCEQSEAIQRRDAALDCFVATLLAMTDVIQFEIIMR